MNLIYQFWSGSRPRYADVSRRWFEEYANKIGAEYLFLDNPKSFSKHGEYFNACRPLFDESFHKYDRVLYLDMDIFPVQGCVENVFEVECKGIAMAEEPDQIEQRKNKWSNTIHVDNDKLWKQKLEARFQSNIPVDKEGYVRTFNSGVVLYTQEFMRSAQQKFINIEQYVDACISLPKFYSLDQNYLNANAFREDYFSPLDVEWNRQLYRYGSSTQKVRPIYDRRTENTKFVHYQVRGRDQLTEKILQERINTPAKEWSIINA